MQGYDAVNIIIFMMCCQSESIDKNFVTLSVAETDKTCFYFIEL